MQQPILARALSLSAMLSYLATQSALGGRAEAEAAIKAGNTNYHQGNYPAAEAYFFTGITNDLTWDVPYNNRGLARFHQGRFADADLDFDTAKPLNTNSASPYLNKGKSLAAQRRFAEAVSELQAGIDRSPTNAALHFNLGWVYDEQGLYPQAITGYSLALGINTNHYRARLGRGVAYARQGSVSNAIADFYAVINDAPAGDMLANIAAYDLQLLRGPGLDFNTGSGATNFLEGAFSFSTEQFDAAIANLARAQTNEPALADIPWIIAWSCLGKRDTNGATAALAQAYALMPSLTIQSIGKSADIFVDGIKRGKTPTTLPLFSNGFDLFLRRVNNSTNQEWAGITYTDGTAGGSNVMRLNPVTVTSFARFGPVADADRDWLGDDWETRWYGDLAKRPQGDQTDYDGLFNVQEFWASTDPTLADSDADGVSDFDEIYVLGTDPVVPSRFYYVNDASTDNDAWCTAPGNDSNDGRQDPAAPKASVQAILDAHDLEPGDVVLIDTGTYDLANNITVVATNGGSSNAPVVFAASSYGVTINRGATTSGKNCWTIEGPYVVLTTALSHKHPALPQTWMKVTGGNCGISVSGSHSRLSRIEACSNYYCGFSLGGASAQVEQSIARGSYNASSGTGIRVGNSSITVSNCTILGNGKYGIHVLGNNGTRLANNVVCADGAGDYGVYRSETSNSLTSDYNLFFTTNEAVLGFSGENCANLASWRRATGRDAHSLVQDPLFVNASAGNCHLRSQAGRYDTSTGNWVLDSATSPGIDRGDPLSRCGDEPPPNGDRINIGAYGNTPLASKSPNQDLDDDCLPDWWEVYYFGTITGVTPQADPDGDGMTNSAEFTAGTDPRNPKSRFTVTAVSVESGCCSLSFPTILGRVYAVEHSDSLTSWSALTSGLPGTGGTVAFNDPSAVGNAHRFYRVSVQLAP